MQRWEQQDDLPHVLERAVVRSAEPPGARPPAVHSAVSCSSLCPLGFALRAAHFRASRRPHVGEGQIDGEVGAPASLHSSPELTLCSLWTLTLLSRAAHLLWRIVFCLASAFSQGDRALIMGE
mmetsp:Transcript_8915/g.26284  ORF Transcript_8915/g.26284 Transcript_8915/m.26284 type:complete len:123 (+) Transcript_8915:495-863(+)